MINYGRIYGAGRNFAEKLLLQFNPSMGEQGARPKASDMYKQTKGNREKKKKDDNIDDENDLTRRWIGGTESEMFNKLEEIARYKVPKTPVLGSAITKTLEPENVGSDVIYFINKYAI